MARSSSAAKPSAPLAFFLEGILAQHAALARKLGDPPSPDDARVALAVVLKACFIKIAQERHFLFAEPLALFKTLMQGAPARRRAAKGKAEVDLFGGREEVDAALAELLDALRLPAAALNRLNLAPLFAFLFTQRLDWLHDDLLGLVYQELAPREERRARGQFYTAPEVVGEMLAALPCDLSANPELKLLDPACGSGQFLLSAYAHLKASLLAEGVRPKDAHTRLLSRHLYGFDSDPFAAVLTRMNLLLKERIDGSCPTNLHTLDSLDRTRTTLTGVPRPEDFGGFDLIVGNPPWGSRPDNDTKTRWRRDYVSARGGLNSFTLFIERALELLKPGGHLAFLIPEAFLNVKAHATAREVLLSRAAIERIEIRGELFAGVFAPAAILIARREPEEEARSAQAVTLKVVPKRGAAATHLRRQGEFAENPEHILGVHTDNEAEALLVRLSARCATLKGHARFHMGLVTGDNARFIAAAPLSEAHEPLLVGTDIEPYRIRYSGHYIVYDPQALQQVAPRSAYDAPLKLVYRFIGKRLVFAIDEAQRLTLNNVNFLVPMLPGFRPRYLLALLNSSLMQFIYTTQFFTLKVLRGNLERLPLRYVNEARQREIEALVYACAGAESEEAYRALCVELDKAVYAIYEVDEESRAFIEARLRRALGTPAPLCTESDHALAPAHA